MARDTDTIVAPATAPGTGGIGIVRVSGPETERLARRILGSLPEPRTATYRIFRDADGEQLDSGLALYFPAPASFTGESVLELHGHGGPVVVAMLVDAAVDMGARLAEPGEFSKRAYLNDKLDLVQAEAIADLIGSSTAQAARAALRSLSGAFSNTVTALAEQLTRLRMHVEAAIDFPEEEIDFLSDEQLLARIAECAAAFEQLRSQARVGRVLRDGINVLILGRPNVGKSSLMNAILGESRAIVTEVAGTTRDTLEEQLVLAGFPVRLIDAAGVRDTEDPVEIEGVKRARDKASSADLVLLVIDGSVALNDEDRLALELCHPEKTLIVINKSDQAQQCDTAGLAGFEHRVAVSAKYNQGLAELGEAIVRHLAEDSSLAGNEGVIITERRHRDALLNGIVALDRLFASTVSAAPRECLAMDLREALGALGRITGETTPDEILEQIFSRFCIGK